MRCGWHARWRMIQAALSKFTKAAFESYFGRQENLDDPDILIAVANGAGLDGEAMRQRSQNDEVKVLLRANTEEVIARRRLWLANHFRRWQMDVFRQRPVAAG